MNKILLFPVFFIILFSSAYVGAGEARKEVAKVRLDNGLTVIIKEDHSQPIVSVQVWVKVGSVNENEKTTGLSHFLEHLIFKGTEKYPGDEISRKTETNGGVINAATSKEFTHFYIDIQKDAYEDAVRILADSMDNAVFPQAEIDKERPVVIEEIRRHDDNPGSVLYDLFNEAMFIKTPYRSSIIGSSDVIKNVSRQEISDYYEAHYVPGNMVLSIAGDLDTKKTLNLVKETFGKQKSAQLPQEPDLVELQHKPLSLARNKGVEHSYWLSGFLGPTIQSDEQFAADITSTILGGGRSSRLYRKLREDKQIVYSIDTSFWSQRGTGLFAVSAVFSPEKQKEVIAEVTSEMERLKTEGPTDIELKRAKEMIKSQWYFGKETFHDQASLLGYWNMQGNPEMIDRYIDGLAKVEKKDVIDFLKKYYEPQGMSQAILLPEKP